MLPGSFSNQRGRRWRLLYGKQAAGLGGKSSPSRCPEPNGGEFIIDAGPESFVTRKRAIWTLTCELGLVDQVIDLGGEANGTYVLDDGNPIRLPLNPIAFVRSPLPLYARETTLAG